MSEAPARPEKGSSLLSEINWALGSILDVNAPTLWARLTRKIQVSGDENSGQFIRLSAVYNVCTNRLAPQLKAVKQVNPGQRFIATADSFTRELRILYGHKLNLLDVNNRHGFKTLAVHPELQAGIDVLALSPTVNISLSDEDYTGYRIQPIVQPGVLLGAAGLYGAMMHWKFPLSVSVTAARVKAGGAFLDLELFTRTRRVEANRVTTVGLTGAMLTMTI